MTDTNSNELTPYEGGEHISTTPVSVSDAMALLPVEEQKSALREYDARRSYFLQWLFSKLTPGTHYGFPPGCDPDQSVDPKRWRAKPSLYKAGAMLIKDLIKLTDEYETDMALWEMAGQPKGTICRRCNLVLYGPNGERRVKGSGAGAFAVGKKGMDANGAIKMADKRALVAAVINTVSVVGELFTQDTEDMHPEFMSFHQRRARLFDSVTVMLIDNQSKWPDTPEDWIIKAFATMTKSGRQKIDTIGKIDAFEKAIEKGKFDINTAAYRG